MTAFNTASNTGSATYTDAYGTVELLASDSVQKASGFQRTSGWRYFEWHIDDQGGDASRLFVGAAMPPELGGVVTPKYLHGGASRAAALAGSIFSPPYPSYLSADASLTACTGDVFMFAVDMTGLGRNHAGVVSMTSLTDGSGQLLTNCYVEVGKNGVWSGATFAPTWAWPSHGFPMQVTPWAARDSTSASAAKVSLKVVTTSFAYALPTGMTAWGDGPEGALLPADDFTLAWDPATTNRGSLSDANRYCIFTDTGESPTAGYVMSVNVAGLTGKRYLEIWNTPPGTTVPAPAQGEVGLYDVSSLTNTFFDTTSKGLNALFYKATNTTWRRGVDISSSSATNAYLAPFNTTNLALNGCGMMIDFDNKKLWFCQPYAPDGAGAFHGPWVGEHSTTFVSGAQPYSFGAMSGVKGLDLSITAATNLLRVGVKNRVESLNVITKFYLNGGQQPFSFYPLLPGARSMNGGRSVAPGQGDSWDVVNNPASATYGAAGVSLFKNLYAGAAQGAQVKFAGKKYFELHLEQDYLISGWYFGLRLGSATTLTHLNIANKIDQALVVRAANSGGARFRYGVNIGSWTATGCTTLAPVMAPWHGVAVDFDRGELWIGTWNYNARAMNWGVSSDPATATNPHFTFTASTSLRIFVCDDSIALRRVNLIQDDNNVVGLPGTFETWGGTSPTSVTATPSSGASGLRNIWPTGVVG